MRVFLFFLFIGDCLGQNLVPNPSFEDYSQCPNSTAQLNYTGNWRFVGASTDYYNACSPQGSMSVPSNIYGYQSAADSNGYIGMIAYVVGNYHMLREPAGTDLIQPLIIGQKYFLSFKAALTLNDFESGGACNKLGAKLSTVAYSNFNPIPVDNFAHVYTNSVISDSVDWTMISGSFIADSAYTFISIGNFFDSTNVQYVDINGLWFTETAYYYIDDVRLSTDSNFVLSTKTPQLEEMEILSIYPNPTSNYICVKFSDNQEHLITIFNSLGQLLLSRIVFDNELINLDFFSKGIYYLRSRNNTIKIIKN